MIELLPGITTTLGISFATLWGLKFYNNGRPRNFGARPSGPGYENSEDRLWRTTRAVLRQGFLEDECLSYVRRQTKF